MTLFYGVKAGAEKIAEAIETEILKQQKQEREEQVDDIYKDLKLKHNTIPQLRLWSKMVCSGIHEAMDKPPDILAFGSSVKKPT